MKQETKIQCYQSAYQMLKEIEYVKGLCYPEKKRNLEFSCEIGDIHVVYNMRLKTDLLTIRGTKKYPGLTDSKLTEIAKEILKNKNYLFTAYEESITFQLSVTVASVPDGEAAKMMERKTEEFIYFLFEVASFPEGVDIHLEPMKEGEENLREKLLARVMVKKSKEDSFVEEKKKPEEPLKEEKLPQEEMVQEEVAPEEPTVEEDAFGSFQEALDDSSSSFFASDAEDFAFSDFEEASSAEEPIPEEPATPEELAVPEEPVISKEDTAPEGSVEPVEDHHSETSDEEKERILFQIEWIAEKNAEIKRKEASLQERESNVDEMEQEASELLDVAKEKTSYWENIRDQYETKYQTLTEKESSLSSLNERLQKQEKELSERETSYNKAKEDYEKQKADLEQRTKACMTKEMDLANETRSLEIITKQVESEKELLTKEKEIAQQELNSCKKELEVARKEKENSVEKEKQECQSKIAKLKNEQEKHLKHVKEEQESTLIKLKADFESILRNKESEYNASTSKVKEEYESKIRNLQEEHASSYNAKEEENRSLKNRCKDLQETLKEKKHSIQKAKEENTELKQKVEEQLSAQWEEKVNSQLKTIESLRSKNIEMKQELQDQRAECDSYSQQIGHFEHTMKEKNQEMLEKDKLINKLKYDIELYKQSETELGVPDDILQDFAETRKKNRQMERELEDVKKEYLALEKSLAESQGIGTPATRDNIITDIIQSGYVEEKKRGLYITELGKQYVENLKGIDILSPAFAARLDTEIKKIQRGEEEFQDVYVDMLKNLHALCNQIGYEKQVVKQMDCPCCKKPLKSRKYSYDCESCGWKINKSICGVEITEEILSCFQKDEPTEKFVFTKKDGKTFEARLKKTKEGIEFSFN